MNELDKTKLKTITIDELEQMKICNSDIVYFFSQSKKHVVLLRAGEYVLPSLIDKYRERGFKSLYVNPKFEQKEFDQWNVWWQKFADASNSTEFELHKTRYEFTQFCKELFIDGSKHGSLLGFVSSTHKTFCSLSSEFTAQYAEKNYTLFKRSMLVAAMSLPLVVSFGYYDTTFLKDLYNTVLLLTYNLADEKFTVLMKNALNLESIENGLGVAYLKEKSPNELPHLLVEGNHVENVESIYRYSNSQIKDLIYFYHQSFMSPASGEKLLDSEIVDWVSAVIFVDRLVEFNDFDFKTEDATGYLKKAIEKNVNKRFLKSYGFRKLKSLLNSYWKYKINEEKETA